jgi:hypothetical protein
MRHKTEIVMERRPTRRRLPSYAIVMYMNTEAQQPEDLASLYRRAFAEYGTRALWNMRPAEDPTPADALAITKALRTHGRMDGRRLAERIEELCRAAR